ncbi:anti-sigma factor domain-containing protein [Lysobacter korlensis]|uniref:Regulator of SigK n=1 Tax=Lysobacter korlensis TaxID=553636 RepID=A0ABV6RY83_9GAMM
MTNDKKSGDDNLSGAYVLNSLSEAERRAFEKRMSASDDLRNEVTELADTAVLLGLATEPVQPSPGLRASVLAAAAQLPQLPRDPEAGVPDAEAATRSAEPAAQRQAPAPGRTAGGKGAEARAAVRWLSRPAGILTAAAAAMALLFAGVLIGGLLSGPTAEQQHAAAFAELNAAPDVQRMDTEVEGAGTVTLVVSQTLERSALVWEEMPELPEDRVYELWYLTDRPVPAGLIDPESGPNFRVLDGPLPDEAQVGLTIEPDGGSDAPTTDPILVMETTGA